MRAEISDGLRSTGERREVVGDVLELRGTCPNFGSDWCRVTLRDRGAPRRWRSSSHADDGSVDVTGSSGPVDVDSDNGSIEVARAERRRCGCRRTTAASRAPTCASPTVTADSDNGRVTLEFAAAPTTVVATSDNGSVEVVVPDDGEAYALDISTDNGSTNDDDIHDDPASPRSITHRHRQRQRHRPHRPLTRPSRVLTEVKARCGREITGELGLPARGSPGFRGHGWP